MALPAITATKNGLLCKKMLDCPCQLGTGKTGRCTCPHGDIAYIHTISANKAVPCKAVGMFCPCEFLGGEGTDGAICATCGHSVSVHYIPGGHSGAELVAKRRELQLWEQRVQPREREAEVKAKESQSLGGRETATATRYVSSTPSAFVCGITKEVMEDPVILVETGQTYERQAIEQWLSRHDTCPIVRDKELQKKDLLPNGSLKRAIEEWRTARLDSQIEILEGSA
jgi:hypothetical protein